jgi:hypothetical protein
MVGPGIWRETLKNVKKDKCTTEGPGIWLEKWENLENETHKL